MANTKVKKDGHGLYVRTNGSVYRPQPSKWSYPHTKAIDPRDPYSGGMSTTIYKEGDQVKIGHVSQSPFCRVNSPTGREEYWHSHGSYIGADSKAIKISEVWLPKN